VKKKPIIKGIKLAIEGKNIFKKCDLNSRKIVGKRLKKVGTQRLKENKF